MRTSAAGCKPKGTLNHGPIVVQTSGRNDLKDRVVLRGTDTVELETGKRGYSAGFLSHKKGPLARQALGSTPPRSSIVPIAEPGAARRSAVSKMDALLGRSPYSETSLTQSYLKRGYREHAAMWEGFCDRWSAAALEPRIASKVNEPRLYKGVYFSIAELRGLASYLGTQDVDKSGDLWISHPSARKLLDACTTLLGPGGPGFIGNVSPAYSRVKFIPLIGRLHQVWNQPFVSATITPHGGYELPRDMQRAIARGHFGMYGGLGDFQVRLVEVRAKFVEEAEGYDDAYEGEPKYDEKKWNFYTLTDAQGEVLKASMAPGSDSGLEYIWVPNHTGRFSTPEGDLFFNKILGLGVPIKAVLEFEQNLARLKARYVDTLPPADARQAFAAAYPGMAAAYPEAALNAALRPVGMSAADFAAA